MSITAVSKPSRELIESLVGGKGVPTTNSLTLQFYPALLGLVSFDVQITDADKKPLVTLLEVRGEPQTSLGAIDVARLDRAFQFTVG